MAGAGEDLELLFHAEKANFLSRNDALVVAVHNILLEEEARCVGKGEEWPTNGENEKGSKTLPRLWNEDQEKVSLRYCIKDKIKMTLSVFADHDNTMVTISDVSTNKTEGVCLDVAEYVNQSYEAFDSTFKNLEELRKRLKQEVLEPLLSHYKNDPPPYRPFMSYNDDYNSPLFVPGSGPGRFGPNPRPVPVDPGRSDLDPLAGRLDPFGYGRRDLDPFAGGAGMGGMLFQVRPDRNPRIPGNFPRGAVPPGARFDPIGPFTGMPMPRPNRPDPDVGPPPGYDDMFY